MLTSIINDFFAVLACAVLLPLSQTWFDPTENEQIDHRQTPILLVHGYLHNSSGWIYHRSRLKKAGIKNIFTIDLGHPFQSIEEYSQKVKEKITEIKKITGKSEIILVGHSMGGVVCSYYATHLAEEHGVNVSKVITLASPLGGTKIAYIAIGECARQMRGNSTLISDLQQRIKGSNVRFFHMGSRTDQIIRPRNSAIIKEKDHFEFREMGHVEYLFSNRVNKRIIQHLKAPRI